MAWPTTGLLAANHRELITRAEHCEGNRLEAANVELHLSLEGRTDRLACATHTGLPVTIIEHFFHHYDVKLGRKEMKISAQLTGEATQQQFILSSA